MHVVFGVVVVVRAIVSKQVAEPSRRDVVGVSRGLYHCASPMPAENMDALTDIDMDATQAGDSTFDHQVPTESDKRQILRGDEPTTEELLNDRFVNSPVAE